MLIRKRIAAAGVLAAFALSPATAMAGDITWPSGDDTDPAGSVVWDRTDSGAAWAQWDIFSNPYLGTNAPDEGSSNAVTTGTSTVTQNGTDSAFIIGPGASGNIYSFAAATAFEVVLNGFGDDTPGTGESNMLVISSWTAGNLWDHDSAVLTYDDGGTPTEITRLGDYSVFSQSSGGGFGGTSEEYQWIYDITGITGPLTWTANSSSSSMSLQQFSADSIAIDASLVPLVPEPASVLLVASGLVLMTLNRRRASR